MAPLLGAPALNAQLQQRMSSSAQCCTSGARPPLPSLAGLRRAPRPSLPWSSPQQRPPGLGGSRLQHLTAKFRRREGEAGSRGQLQVVASGPAGGGLGGHGGEGLGQPVDTPGKAALLAIAVGYMSLIVIVPFIAVFFQAFAKGLGPFVENLLEPDFLHAVKMTLLLALCAVPINTVFGTTAAIFLSKNNFPGKVFVISLLDLPFSISPVVTGMMLVLLYGRKGFFAPVIAALHLPPIIFAFPGMLLATLFVTMPFVARELLPILDALDPAEEEAAKSLGASDWEVFWNVTVPNIRWGLLYGIILTNARAMGEFGAVAVISGNIIGFSQTLTLYCESCYKEYNQEAAFTAAVFLSFMALITLVIKDRLESRAAKEMSK